MVSFAILFSSVWKVLFQLFEPGEIWPSDSRPTPLANKGSLVISWPKLYLPSPSAYFCLLSSVNIHWGLNGGGGFYWHKMIKCDGNERLQKQTSCPLIADTTHCIHVLKTNNNQSSGKRTWQHHVSHTVHPDSTC